MKKINKETMKTNQLMNVQLGAMGLVNAWHKNQMLKLEDLLIIGNELRVAKGLAKRRLDVYLKKVDTWEYMVKVWNSEIVGVKDVVQNKAILELKSCASVEAPLNIVVSKGLQYSTLDDLPRYDSDKSKINYQEVNRSNQFKGIYYRKSANNPLVSQEQETYANVFIAIDFAMWMDVDIKHEVIKTFIEHKILEKRDNGGVAFKKLNSLINTLENGNSGCHKYVAQLINTKVNGEFTLGWNDEKKQAKEHKLRVKYLEQLANYIEMGFITTYQQLKQTIRNLK